MSRATMLALLIVAVGVLLRVIYPSTIYFNIHAERDAWRTVEILRGESFPWLGSELTQGGRTPGPGLYWLQLLPLAITHDPRGLLVWLALLHGVGIWFTYRIGRDSFSEKVGLAAAGLFATFPLTVFSTRYLWNPSYIFPLTAIFYWALTGWLWRREERRLPFAAFALGLLLQVHVSALALIAFAVVCALVLRPPLSRRDMVLTGAALLLVFSPYLIGEAMHGFSNTRNIVRPPEKLETANKSDLPIFEKKRFTLNEGAMKAMQVALSPVFYDRRYETGSFSYLNLLGEFGPVELPGIVWKFVFTLHRLRWGYIAAHAAMLVMLAWLFVTGCRARFLDGPAAEVTSSRKIALTFLLAFLIVAGPMTLTATMTAPKDGKVIGIGAIRYYFVLFPIPFIMLALLARRVAQAMSRWGSAKHLPAMAVAFLVILQASTAIAALVTAHKMKRCLKYSLYETFDWSVQRRAADILIDEWGVTPDQFAHHVSTLDDTFNSQRWDIASLEQGLDWAYFFHPRLHGKKLARYPESHFALYDVRRGTEPKLPPDAQVLDRREAGGGLVLLRLSSGPEHDVSPIQNTWVKMHP